MISSTRVLPRQPTPPSSIGSLKSKRPFSSLIPELFGRIVNRQTSSPSHLSKKVENLTELASGKYTACLNKYHLHVEGLGNIATKNTLLKKTFGLLKEFKKNPSNSRGIYKEFISCLEKAAELTNLDDNDRKIVQKLCYARFFETDLSSYFNECLDRANCDTHDLSGGVTLQEFAEKSLELNKRFDALRTKLQFIGTMIQRYKGDRGNTKMAERNPPNFRGEQRYGDMTVTAIRHGRPTKDSGLMWWKSQANSKRFLPINQRIDPEYIAALKEAEDREEGVFYVVHQKTKGHGSESAASELIFNLEKDHENFFCLSQRVEGQYFERNLQSQPESVQDLTEEFMAQFETGGSNRLPGSIQDDQTYKEELKGLLETSMNLLFKEGLVQTKEERQTFILLSYVVQKEHLKKYLNAKQGGDQKKAFPIKYYSTVCKDDLDRGGNMMMVETLFQTLLTEKSDKEKEKLYSQNLQATVVAPYMVRKTGVLQHRIDPGLKVADHLSHLSQSNVAGLRELFKEKGILIEDLSISEKLPPKKEAADQKPISAESNGGSIQSVRPLTFIGIVGSILHWAVSKLVGEFFETFI